jgi:hypothetical protein
MDPNAEGTKILVAHLDRLYINSVNTLTCATACVDDENNAKSSND